MKKRVTADFETRSACDLKSAGAYKYSLDSTTRPICLAFKCHGEDKVYFLDFKMINTPWSELPDRLKALWNMFVLYGYEFSAHNAFFEQCIYNNILVVRYGWPVIDPRRWRCTAAKAASCALPRNLQGAGEAMRLKVQKDKRGYNAMMMTCKPTKQYNAWRKANEDLRAGKRLTQRRLNTANAAPPAMFLEPEVRPDVWETLYTYCKFDVRSEEELDDSLPDLILLEQEIWFLNQKLNWRGLRIDIPTVKKIVSMMEAESKLKLAEMDSLTMGLVTKPGARQSILDFLALDDIVLPDIRAKTVEDILKDGALNEDMRRLLEIRQALSKTSTRKYQSFVNRANEDDRVRDILLYHGASTGRDTGSGIQPHNFPRGAIRVSKDRPYAAVDNIVACKESDDLRMLYGESLSILFSSVLRNMIIPSPGKELFVADFSKIEVAVLWWLSDNEPGLKILRAGLDPYKYMASENTGASYESIADDSDDRQLGKAQVLGCGFGMGWEKFQKTAFDQYRLKLSDAQSKKAVYSYREANAAVPQLWKNYELAAVKAIEDKVIVTIGKCKFFVKDSFLWIELPSGRRLAYKDPKIIWRVRELEFTNEKGEKTKFNSEPQKTVTFFAVNSKTKQWGPEISWGGVWTENIVQAVARDLMMPAMLRLEKANYLALLAVHDEGICEKEIGKGSIKEFVQILCEQPSWGKGLPIEAKGWKDIRYRK